MSRNWNNDGKTLVKILIVAFIVLAVASYIFFQSRNLIEGPRIILSSPENAVILNDPKILIAGKAKNISFLTLNDRQIYIDDKGLFSEELLLSPGYNMWTIYAKDKFGRNVTKKIELVFRKS